jgi:hypothetical protein
VIKKRGQGYAIQSRLLADLSPAAIREMDLRFEGSPEDSGF